MVYNNVTEGTPYRRPEWVWYVASFVVESRIKGMSEPIVTIESILFRAESPEAVYKKAELRCTSSDPGYRNQFGHEVWQRYVGIHNIEDLQCEQPDDELVLGVRVVSSLPDKVGCLIRSKDELSLFGGQRLEFSLLNQ